MPTNINTSNLQSVKRNVALCYIRQSVTRDGTDTNSPDRQRANIQTVCNQNNWTPEWYQDTEGHKSGRTEKNRPGWLALKARLNDPDIVALVANDLSRLHRKGWRIGDLLDFVEEHKIRLVLASPTSQIADLSNIQGRMMLQMAAMFDEWYAADISQRAKDSVSHRKNLGKTIGLPPFGTHRNAEGYLVPTDQGVWLLPDGTAQAGIVDQPPMSDAVWRAYFTCAERMLTLFAQGNYGMKRIAYILNDEGWLTRDRKGTPKPILADDVRRTVANWPEYGGLIRFQNHNKQHGRSRRAYEYRLDNVTFDQSRAVFPVELLLQVARVHKHRSFHRPDHGVRFAASIFSLSEVTYCAHCEALARTKNDPRLRTRITGHNQGGVRRYRHRPGVKCGCRNQSVLSDIYEQDFLRLIQHLEIRSEAIALLNQISLQNSKLIEPNANDMEVSKREGIATAQRRIDAAVVLFGDGRISQDEYRRRVAHNETEIVHWNARTRDTDTMALELTMCVEALQKMSRLWRLSTDEDKQGLVRTFFTELVYDLDSRQIVSFKLKPWADRFLVLRAQLYKSEETGVIPLAGLEVVTVEGNDPEVPHTGVEPVSQP